jgi:putative transposase
VPAPRLHAPAGTPAAKGRQQAVCWLATAHQTVRRPRADCHHTPALALVQSDDTSSHDDLRVAPLVRRHSLAQSMAAAGGSAFLAILAFTAARAGRPVVAGDPAFTSQVCSGCGVLVQNGLSVR